MYRRVENLETGPHAQGPGCVASFNRVIKPDDSRAGLCAGRTHDALVVRQGERGGQWPLKQGKKTLMIQVLGCGGAHAR